MKKITLSVALVFSSCAVCLAGQVSCTYSRLEASAPISFKRQFARVQSEPITITIDELQAAYSFGSKQINNYIKLNSAQQIDVGVKDLSNAQDWSMLNQSFQNRDTLLIVALKETGYEANFPNSDFALKRKNKGCTNCDEYIFANYQEEGIYMDGDVGYDRADAESYIDTLDYLITSLPVAIDNYSVLNDTIEDDDTTVYLKGYEKMIGFGKFTASDGSTHEVLQSALVYSRKVNNVTKYFKTINFMSDDGYLLFLTLSDTNQVAGNVSVVEIDEYIFTSGVTDITTSDITLKNKIKCYPNPVSSTLQIENAGDEKFQIVNSTGNVVIDIENHNWGKLEVNVSKLSAGIYTLLSGKASARFVKID
ncbi:MAG: T9SS type A sorting domain-containing protein [Cytophagales bacterium]